MQCFQPSTTKLYRQVDSGIFNAMSLLALACTVHMRANQTLSDLHKCQKNWGSPSPCLVWEWNWIQVHRTEVCFVGQSGHEIRSFFRGSTEQCYSLEILMAIRNSSFCCLNVPLKSQTVGVSCQLQKQPTLSPHMNK